MQVLIDLRQEKINFFLKNYFLEKEIEVQKIPGDAGLRNYSRIWDDCKSYILMDCPPSYTSIAPFIKVAELLRNNSILVPSIFDFDIENGFILLEDFGSLSGKDYLLQMSDKYEIEAFYKICIDKLLVVQDISLPEYFIKFTDEILLSELNLFLDWYIPYVNGEKLKESIAREFHDIWKEIFSKRLHFNDTVVLRDFHVENILLLDKNNIVEKIGFIDFQDAIIGSPIYDLVSILEDARIDVDREFALDMIRYFALKQGFNFEDVLREYCILGSQRNMKILGVFARKSLRDGVDKYLEFIPRVIRYLEYDFSIPELYDLRKWFSSNIIFYN